MNWKSHFSRFAAAAPDRLHFAAHSHHPWPDVSFDAHQQAWLDASRLADLKWDKVFGEIIPAAQRHVARVLSLPDPSTLCFAPSTHELVMRLLSALPAKPRVLTTDSEFHSFSRQMKRLEEEDLAQVTRIAIEPFVTFADRFAAAARAGTFDLVYFSQCFFNTAFLVNEIAPLVAAVKDPGTAIVVDGYHAFMAVPVDLSELASRIFYTAGGYKYAMAGEGACFLHCPRGFAPRPVNTGWFASFGTLTTTQHAGDVPYAQGGQRFMGATFDPTPLYRLIAVQEWLQRENIEVAEIRRHVQALQEQFIALPAARRIARAAEGRAGEFPRLSPPRGPAPPRRTPGGGNPHGLPRRPAADRLRHAPGRRRRRGVLQTTGLLVVKLALGYLRAVPSSPK